MIVESGEITSSMGRGCRDLNKLAAMTLSMARILDYSYPQGFFRLRSLTLALHMTTDAATLPPRTNSDAYNNVTVLPAALPMRTLANACGDSLLLRLKLRKSCCTRFGHNQSY